jgi:hypothetical protein
LGSPRSQPTSPVIPPSLIGHGAPDEADLPLGFIVGGGEPVGDEDVGYGPARLFTVAEVRAIHDALAPISRHALMARWDPAAFAEEQIYGVSHDDPEAEDEYVGVYYDDLKAFVGRAAKEGLALLSYLS